MPRLTLRTLLAYLDDTLPAAEAHALGQKVAASDEARELVERIKRATRRRGLKTPVPGDAEDDTADPNTVAEYLDNQLDGDAVRQVEETCLGSDVHLAEVAACHQILTLVLTEPVKVPPRAHRRMYALAPSGRPKRRPNPAMRLSPVRPPEPDRAEPDDADAALLLGLKRYAAADSGRARVALAGIGLGLLALLALGVYMALPRDGSRAPDAAPGHSFALAPPEPAPGDRDTDAPPPRKPKAPDERPKPPDPKEPDPKEPAVKDPDPKAKAPEPRPADPDPKAKDPDPAFNDPVPPPDPKVAEVGSVRTPHSLVVALDPARPGRWLRLRAKVVGKGDDDPVPTGTPVMALPGYKADLLVGPPNRQVQVQLWGNVPELLPYRVFESKVTFHVPPAGFDADLTLHAGRVYLQSKKGGADKKGAGAKVRVRAAGEVWDVALPDEKAEVLVELVSWFEPGTRYARKGAAGPRLEARVATVAGAAGLAAPRRYKEFPDLAPNTQLSWDSRTGNLTGPAPVPSEQEASPRPTLNGDEALAVTRVLSAMADQVADRTAVRAAVEGRLQPAPGLADRDIVGRTAVYAHVALADCSADGCKTLQSVVDELNSQLPWPVRQAAVTALAHWLARDGGNTELLRAVLVEKRIGEDAPAEDAADHLLRLLRGFVSPLDPVPERLDELVRWLESPSIPVREAALWNLAAAEQRLWTPRPLFVNVGAVGAAVNSDDYRKFLATARAKAEAIKRRAAEEKK